MSFLGRLARLPLRLVPNGRVMPVLSGELRGMKWIAGSATHGAWLGTYERDNQRVFHDLIAPGDVVYDIGANAGFFTLVASRRAGPEGVVYAFEPLPSNLDLLRRHVALNDIRNVRIVPLAVAATTGFARFEPAASAAMGGLHDSGSLEVRTTSIDDFVASGETKPPSFMKIDVEGAETDVLNGAARTLARHAPAILLSTHGYKRQEECRAFLESAGFALQLLRDGARDGNYVVLAQRRTPR